MVDLLEFAPLLFDAGHVSTQASEAGDHAVVELVGLYGVAFRSEFVGEDPGCLNEPHGAVSGDEALVGSLLYFDAVQVAQCHFSHVDEGYLDARNAGQFVLEEHVDDLVGARRRTGKQGRPDHERR